MVGRSEASSIGCAICHGLHVSIAAAGKILSIVTMTNESSAAYDGAHYSHDLDRRRREAAAAVNEAVVDSTDRWCAPLLRDSRQPFSLVLLRGTAVCINFRTITTNHTNTLSRLGYSRATIYLSFSFVFNPPKILSTLCVFRAGLIRNLKNTGAIEARGRARPK